MRDPEEWKRLVDEAKPVVIHVMETLAAGQNLEDAKVKSQIANQVLPLVEDVPDPIERETYRQRLARLLRVDERALVSEGRARQVRPRRGRPTPSQEVGEATAIQTNQIASGYPLETHCLGILLRRPDFVFRIDRELQQDKLPRLAREDFERYEHQAIFHLIQESLEQDLSEPQNYVFNHLDLLLMDEADRLLVGTENFDVNEDRVFEDLRRSILKVRERQVHLNLDNLRNLMLDTGQADSVSLQDYMQYMRTNVETLKHIHQALGRSPQRQPTTY
jgi:DNA primase